MKEGRTCGNCIFLETDDGEPFYCIREDLYTIREKKDAACMDWWLKDAMKARKSSRKAKQQEGNEQEGEG